MNKSQSQHLNERLSGMRHGLTEVKLTDNQKDVLNRIVNQNTGVTKFATISSNREYEMRVIKSLYKKGLITSDEPGGMAEPTEKGRQAHSKIVWEAKEY
jgi:hypothetical protein